MSFASFRLARLGPRWLTSAIVLAIWLGSCAAQLVHEIGDPQRLGIGICATLILAPFLLVKIARLPVYLLTAYAALVPFSDLLGTEAGPSYFRLLGILTGCSLLLSMVSMRRVMKPSRSVVVLLLLEAYAGATIFWARDPSIALADYSTFLSEMVLFTVISLYPIALRDMKLILGGTIVGAVAAAGYGDFFFSHAQAISASRLNILSGEGYAIDPNDFAAFLLVPSAITLAMFLRSHTVASKLCWLAVFFFLLSGIAVSGSRGGTLALVAMGFFLFLRTQHKRRLVTLACAGLVAVIASPVGQRFAQSDITNGDLRVDIWRVGIASLHQYWLAGAGVGNFNQAFMQYFLTVPHQPLGWDRVAHSIFVGTAVELGVFGFALMIVFWYLEFRDLAHVNASGLVVDICSALRAGILGIFVAGFFLSLMTSKYTWLAFSLVALMRSALITSGIPIDAPSHRASERREAENLESLRAKLAGERF
jgi:hypothetical protein